MDIFLHVTFDLNYEWSSEEDEGREGSLNTVAQNWRPCMKSRKWWSNVLSDRTVDSLESATPLRCLSTDCYFIGCTINVNIQINRYNTRYDTKKKTTNGQRSNIFEHCLTTVSSPSFPPCLSNKWLNKQILILLLVLRTKRHLLNSSTGNIAL